MGSIGKLALALLCINVCVHAAQSHRIYRTSSDNPQDFLKVHNNARIKLGLAPLQWDARLAAFAKSYVNLRASTDCELIHSKGPYGENIFWGGGDQPWGAKFAVRSWSKEKHFYDYSTNSCTQGQMCGHYTQIIWKDTKRVGCARAVCRKGAGELIICNYDPPGNYQGERPY